METAQPWLEDRGQVNYVQFNKYKMAEIIKKKKGNLL